MFDTLLEDFAPMNKESEDKSDESTPSESVPMVIEGGNSITVPSGLLVNLFRAVMILCFVASLDYTGTQRWSRKSESRREKEEENWM